MKAVSFILSGKTACFRKPDVNQYAYFTYNNIHKPALLGLLGAIAGYEGYSSLHQRKKTLEEKIKKASTKEKKALKIELEKLQKEFPQFYENLQHLKVAIKPMTPNGYFSKKVQVFNNSVGYASFEEGGNLIVREQWLEEPVWQIMIKEDESDIYEKIKSYLLESKAVFIPYLGKNDHPAKITDAKEVVLYSWKPNEKIASLFIENAVALFKHAPRNELSFFFSEYAPVRLQEDYHFYEFEKLVFTNYKVESSEHEDIYTFENENFFFL